MDTLVAALVSATVSIIIGIISYSVNKNQIKTDTISKNRIVWIREVRNLVKEFLNVYSDGKLDDQTKAAKLTNIKNHISLYLRSNVTSYDNLLLSLNRCIVHKKNDLDRDELIKHAQVVFSDVWIRAKMEAGISKREETKYRRLFEKITKRG